MFVDEPTLQKVGASGRALRWAAWPNYLPGKSCRERRAGGLTVWARWEAVMWEGACSGSSSSHA